MTPHERVDAYLSELRAENGIEEGKVEVTVRRSPGEFREDLVALCLATELPQTLNKKPVKGNMILSFPVGMDPDEARARHKDYRVREAVRLDSDAVAGRWLMKVYHKDWPSVAEGEKYPIIDMNSQ